MPGLARLGAQRRDVEPAAAQIEDSLLQDARIGHEARGGMAAVGQPDVDDLGMWPIDLHMPGIEVMRIVGDIGFGDEVVAGTPFDPKVDAARIADPARLEGSDGRIDGELRRDGQRHLRADAAAQPDRAITAHALAVGDDMQIARGQLTNPTAGFVDLGILVPVVVARDDVDRVDAIRVKEDFSETGAIERAVVGVGLESHDAAGAGVPSQVLYRQLGVSEDFRGYRRGSGQFRQRRGRSTDVGSMTPYGTANPASTAAERARRKKALSQCCLNR